MVATKHHKARAEGEHGGKLLAPWGWTAGGVNAAPVPIPRGLTRAAPAPSHPASPNPCNLFNPIHQISGDKLAEIHQ